jgi:hypothetical protein
MTTLLEIGLVGAIAVVLAAPLAARIIRRRFDPFEPIVLFILAYGVMFVVRPAAMLATDSLVYVGPLRTLDVSGTFTEMLSLALLGAVAFNLGYIVPARKKRTGRTRPARENIDVRRLLFLAGLLTAFGVAAFVTILAMIDGLNTLGEIFRLGRHADLAMTIETYRYIWMSFLFLIPAATVFLAVGLHARSRWLIIVFVCLAALILLQAVPFGDRETLLPFLGGVFVLMYISRSARPSLWTLVAVAAVALFASAFLSDLRGRAERGETVADSVVRASSPSRLADSVLTGPDSEMAATLAAALSVIPEKLPHTYGKTIFGDLVIRPAPRAIWAGKPETPRNDLKSVLWPTEHAKGTINPEFSVLLYFYWDFGLVGVVVGLGAYGMGARYLYEYFMRNHERVYVQVLYSLSVWFLVIALRDSPVDTLVRAAFILAPVCVLFPLARRSGRAAQSEPASARA